MTDTVVLETDKPEDQGGQVNPTTTETSQPGNSKGVTVSDEPKPEGQPEPKADDKPERPEWLPEEFDTPEEFAEAWKSGKTPEPKADDKPTEADTPEKAEEAVTKAGLDMAKLSEEFARDGKLADESYEALEKAGITKTVVDAYIEGQRAQGQLVRQQLSESLGGDENLEATLGWAATNLSESEKAAANAVLHSGDIEQSKLVLAGINARRIAVDGQEPQLVTGKSLPPSRGAAPYRSTAEWMADVNSKSYRTDESFREKVARRIAASNF